MRKLTPESNDAALTQFYKDWQQAQQAAVGAANEALLKEARFKGAAELVHGPSATFDYTDGKLTFKVAGGYTGAALPSTSYGRRNHAS